MTRSSANLLDRLLFRDSGIIPSKKLLIWMVLLSAALITAAFFGGLPWPAVFAVNGVVLAATLFDVIFLPRKNQVDVRRIMPDEMERGIRYNVSVEVENRSGRDVHAAIIDGLPQSFVRPFPVTVVVPGGGETADISYETAAPVRGQYTAGSVYLRITSSWGLWQKQITVVADEPVKVIPDLSDTRRYLENADKFLLHEGERIRRQRSGTGEFAQIRNYVPGDDPRKINWRQTAKLREVMANEYEPEHGKYITILVDCGRMMGAELKETNRLEKSLEAALTVAAAALDKGDYVSVTAFSRKVNVYVPPAKGRAHLKTIIDSVYGLQADDAESDYAGVLNYLQTVQKKRSFMLLFTDVRTFLHEESALVYLKRLRQRHLFYMIGIEDELLLEHAGTGADNVKGAVVKSMAQNQLLIKKRRKMAWEKQGLNMIEAAEDQLAVTAVSHYIRMMNRGMV